MQPNLNSFERAVRLLLGVFFLFAAAVLYVHPVARIAAALFGLFALGEGLTAKCRLAAALDLRASTDKWQSDRLYLLGLAVIQFVLGYEWWSAGWEKVSSGDFVSGITKTLGYFASKNPFSWYKSFLEGFAMKNATAFAYAVEWSQVAIALALTVGAAALVFVRSVRRQRQALMICCLALLGGLLMNANFYLAAGWTGPGTKGSNVVMFWSQATLLYVWASSLFAKAGVDKS